MKLRKVIFRIALIVSIPLLAGCASKSELDKVSADLATAQSTIETLQTDVAKLSTELEDAKSALSDAESQVDELESTVAETEATNEALQTEIDDLNVQFEKAGALVEVIHKIFIPSLTGEIFTLSENEAVALFLDWTNSVEAADDPQLSALFDGLINSDFSDQQMNDFFIYLIDSALQAFQ